MDDSLRGKDALDAASARLAEGRFDDARRLAEIALEGPLDVGRPYSERGEHVDMAELGLAHHIVGTAKLELGDRRGAIASLSLAIAADRSLRVALSNRAVARREEGDLDGALADFDAALALSPTYAHARYNRALVLAAKGRLEEAEADHLRLLVQNGAAKASRDAWNALRARRSLTFDDDALRRAMAELHR